MPSGYQNRIGPTYWTSTELTWDGVKWFSGSALTSFTLSATSALERTQLESRFLIKVNAVKQVVVYADGFVTPVEEILLCGASPQIFTLRFLISNFGPIGPPSQGPLQLTFDHASTVEILEIEVGLNGTH